MEPLVKEKILKAISESRSLFEGSDNKFATSLGISAAQYSRIKNNDTVKVLSDANWIMIARKLRVELTDKVKWVTVATHTFQFITGQLEMCQVKGQSALLSDLADIGKTFSAKYYTSTHKNVVFVDCSQVKSKQRLVRYIAKEFGIGSSGKFTEVYEDLVYYLKTLSSPLIILDEAGDLNYDAFLELKALWNATEGYCGWYMMGAGGLRNKIRRAIDCNKVGYDEIFSRYGKRYIRVLPIGEECKRVTLEQAYQIAKANCELNQSDTMKLVRRCFGDDGIPSLRRVFKEIQKLNYQNNIDNNRKEAIA